MRSTRPTRRSAPRALLALCVVASLVGGAGAAGARDASTWREIEIADLLGVTTGSGIGRAGETEFGSVGRFDTRGGHHAATEITYESEFTASQFVPIEFGAPGSIHEIGGMIDRDDRNQAAFVG